MAFEDEWRELVSDAKARQSETRQLTAGAGPGDAGGPPSGADLVAHQDDLGAVGDEACQLHAVLRGKADIAGEGADGNGSGSTDQAAGELAHSGFAMGGELRLTVGVWGSQVKTVLQMCAHISNHLDYTKKAHAQDEAEIAASLRHRDGSAMSVSELSKHVK